MSSAFYRALKPHQLKILRELVRVDQAGELGAKYIYMGQLCVLKNTKYGPILQHMKTQEQEHLNEFNRLIPNFRVRPSALEPVWSAAGFIIGAATAALGHKTAMTCTKAVEQVIGNHYNDQIRDVLEILSDPDLKDLEGREEFVTLASTLQKFRDEELEHLDTAVDNEADQAPCASLVQTLISRGSQLAIQIARKI